MKSSLALFAEPVLASARRLFWVSTLLLWLPMTVYITWLNQGHSLWLLQGVLVVVSMIGLVVINAKTAVVIYGTWGGAQVLNLRPSRGLIQHLGRRLGLLRAASHPMAPAEKVWPKKVPIEEGSLAGATLETQLALPPSALVAPFTSVVVVAYLPNEQDIIEDALLHYLTQVTSPAAGWKIFWPTTRRRRCPWRVVCRLLLSATRPWCCCRWPQATLRPRI